MNKSSEACREEDAEMSADVEIISVDAVNVADHGFFCFKSKRKSEGYRRKLEWLTQRLSEGLKLKIVYENGRQVGFIEYIPGEFAWRAVRADGYMVIHCLWVVGRGKQKGYGSRLLSECIDDARRLRKHGVAMVTRKGGFLAGKKLFLKHGFEVVDRAPPAFDLLVKRFADGPLPAFPKNWAERAERYGPGLTVVRSGQCPYLDDAVNTVVETAGEIDMQVQVIELQSGQEARDTAPSAYGVFSIVHNGELLSFHPIGKKKLLERLGKEPE
jgi:ribosomal protein S18 acetylase RimI-like enzyme